MNPRFCKINLSNERIDQGPMIIIPIPILVEHLETHNASVLFLVKLSIQEDNNSISTV